MRTRGSRLPGQDDDASNAGAGTGAGTPASSIRPARPPPPPPRAPPPPPRLSPDVRARAGPPALQQQLPQEEEQEEIHQEDPPPAPHHEQQSPQAQLPPELEPLLQQQPPQQQLPQPPHQQHFVAEQAQAPLAEVATQTVDGDWVLRIRTPRQRRRENPSLPSILLIQVLPGMSDSTLAACIQQALFTNPNSSSTSSGILMNDDSHRIVGLFVEHSGVFVALQSILQTTHRSVRHDTYCLHLEPRPPPPKPVPWWERPEIWIAVLLPVAAYLWYAEAHVRVGPAVYETGFTFYSTILYMIQMPLQELYRHGPWLIGWEGDSLPRICARITYHGDASFWSRNFEECERIYAAKEEAWLRMARPIVYGILAVTVTTIVRFILWERAQHNLRMAAQLRGPPTDRDMVETYRAFQVIMRQVGRTLGPATTAAQPPQAQDQGQGNHKR
jgi:hypothetical protein